MFIFVLQTIWLYISELAGKDLDVWIVLKFLWYVSPRLIPLVLPLTVLVTSLMVFGNFAEKYEFAAMKSTGISLQRAMRVLMVFIAILSVTAFFFSNNVIPYSEYKWQNLRRNIAQTKPSMVITEGQFSQVGDNFNIKVAEKSGDQDQFLDNVVIHKKNDDKPNGNYTVIIADNGELASEEGSNTLSLILNDGNYYEDVQVNDVQDQRREPFAKSEFKEYTINIDLTEFNNADFDKDNNYSNENMYTTGELVVEMDSLSGSYTNDVKSFSDNMYFRSGISKFGAHYKPFDKKEIDTDTVNNVLDVFNTDEQVRVLDLSLNNTRGTLQSIQAKQRDFFVKSKRLNKFEIAFHEKYVLGVACVILFFVGAPLGAIIRKGGMGLPMVVAVLLFLTYHFIGIFAKNSAEDGTMHPFIATWLSTAIMLPLSIWLTYRATTDQGIIDIDSFLQRIGKLFKKKEDVETSELEFIDIKLSPISISKAQFEKIKSFSNDKLKDIVKNYKQYEYTEDYRLAVLKELNSRGITQEQLKFSGELYNKKYEKGKQLILSFKKSSRYTFIFYIIFLITPIISSFLNVYDNTFVTIIVLTIFVLSIILFHVYLLKTHKTVSSFCKLTGENNISDAALFVGFIFYLLLFFYYKSKMKSDLKLIR